ncbi:MAG: OmpH family outer membrane protein [Alphaproteobacteria bacterium]|nr:OmpH family outer membrane protein [Alphaproteobacteria bacterium]
MLRFLSAVAFAALLLPSLAAPAAAQNQDYFIPGQNRQSARPKTAPVQRPVPPAPTVGGTAGFAMPPGGEPGDAAEAMPPPQNYDLPPAPELPPIPKGEAPPAAVIGVLGVPEVMRASTAAQAVEKVIGERRNKLNEDAQKEQGVWRDMQQALVNDRAKLSADQIRKRERDLQERITNAQRTFRERNRIIQEAAQYALQQIERTLVGVIRQVAEARGMNLVLHRSQVALNVNQFDITGQVAEQLNKVLVSVVIPPDGVSPATLAKATDKATPAAASGPAAAKTAPAPATKPAPAPKPAPAK